MNYRLYFQEDSNIHRRGERLYNSAIKFLLDYLRCPHFIRACSSLAVSRSLARNFLRFREADRCASPLSSYSPHHGFLNLLPSRYPRNQLSSLSSERYITIVSPSVRPYYDFCQFYDLIKKNYHKI